MTLGMTSRCEGHVLCEKPRNSQASCCLHRCMLGKPPCCAPAADACCTAMQPLKASTACCSIALVPGFLLLGVGRAGAPCPS